MLVASAHRPDVGRCVRASDASLRVGTGARARRVFAHPQDAEHRQRHQQLQLRRLAFDPSAPIDEASARINTTAFVFTRAFSVAGRSANAGVVVPVVGGHVEGLYLGEFAAVDRFGLGDPRLRFAMNLYGAPSMTPKEFASYQFKTIVGVSLSVAPPLGQYDPTKLITSAPIAGRSSRRSGSPVAAASGSSRRWPGSGSSPTTPSSSGRTREQNPIIATQVHVTYRFKRSMWLAGNVNFFTGGRTTIGGKQSLDLQRNSRVGATFSQAFKGGHAIRASVSRGAYTTIGAAFTSIARLQLRVGTLRSTSSRLNHPVNAVHKRMVRRVATSKGRPVYGPS